jgi:uncharacterized protein YbjT (DUF2867 family)
VNTGGKIAVAGATGRVGRHVADVLEEQGHDVVAISRSAGVDLVTGDGLADALHGVESVVDASSGASPEEQTATDFFTAANVSPKPVPKPLPARRPVSRAATEVRLSRLFR